MAYSSNINAEDVLRPSTVVVTLPASALRLDAIRDLLGLSKKDAQWALDHLDSPSQRAWPVGKSQPRLAKVEVFKVSWEWDSEVVEVYDEEGSAEMLELKKGYGIDQSEVGAISKVQHRVGQALRCLGIPHDCEMFDSIEGSSTIQRSRLKMDSAIAKDYCDDWPFPDPLDPKDVLDMARKSPDLAIFTEWLQSSMDECPSLGADSLRFDEIASAPGRASFIEASARVLNLCSSPSRAWGQDVALTWRPEISTWIRQESDGEDPLARFARCALPIGLPRLEMFIAMALAQPEPDELFIASSLSAYCVANSGSAWSARDHRASARAASVVGKCLGTMPHLAARLGPTALAFFQLDLAAPDDRASDASYAETEAHWLRAQSIVAGGTVRSTRRAAL